MNNKIFALTDYKNNLGSKWKSIPYRSGLDKALLEKYFSKYGYFIKFIRMHDVDFNKDWENKIIIYTSSEDFGLNYKSYIEDVILGLDRLGAIVIPQYDFLRAHNNKVYMEILRNKCLKGKINQNSRIYGTLEELKTDLDSNKIIFPCVVKSASGAMSRGVYLAENKDDLVKYSKRISRTKNFKYELKDTLRAYKYKGYKKESKFQKKFIVQKYIPGLKNDWKVLVYGDHFYTLNRGIKKKDFRASGSHHNYKAGSDSEFPLEMLDVIEDIFFKLNVPHLSLDFAYDGKNYYLHEFQAIYFGTSTLDFCKDYFTKRNDKWIVEKQQFDQEEEYIWGLVKYFEKHPNIFK